MHAKVNRHDQFFLFAGAFDKSSSADDEGAPETKRTCEPSNQII